MGRDSAQSALYLSKHSELCSTRAVPGPVQLRVPLPDWRCRWPLPFRAAGKVSRGTGAYPCSKRSGSRSAIPTPRTGAGFRAIPDVDRSVGCDAGALPAPSRMAQRGVARAGSGPGFPGHIQRERSPRVPTGLYLRHVQRLELQRAFCARPDPVCRSRPSFYTAPQNRPSYAEAGHGGHNESVERPQHHSGRGIGHGPIDDAGRRKRTDDDHRTHVRSRNGYDLAILCACTGRAGRIFRRLGYRRESDLRWHPGFDCPHTRLRPNVDSGPAVRGRRHGQYGRHQQHRRCGLYSRPAKSGGRCPEANRDSPRGLRSDRRYIRLDSRLTGPISPADHTFTWVVTRNGSSCSKRSRSGRKRFWSLPARAPDPMKSSTSRKEAFFSATSCGRSTVNPTRKKFSAPTSSRISTMAPSRGPMVMARLSATFMFAGAAGLLAGHEDLFGQIPGRVDMLSALHAEIWQEDDPGTTAHRWVIVHGLGHGVYELDIYDAS